MPIHTFCIRMSAGACSGMHDVKTVIHPCPKGLARVHADPSVDVHMQPNICDHADCPLWKCADCTFFYLCEQSNVLTWLTWFMATFQTKRFLILFNNSNDKKEYITSHSGKNVLSFMSVEPPFLFLLLSLPGWHGFRCICCIRNISLAKNGKRKRGAATKTFIFCLFCCTLRTTCHIWPVWRLF